MFTPSASRQSAVPHFEEAALFPCFATFIPPAAAISADVVDMLKEKGFTNINLRKEADLINGWVNKEGSVKEVIFAGNSDYSKEDRFFPDVKITIVYHVFPDKKG